MTITKSPIIKKNTGHKTIASKFSQIRNNYSHYLLRTLRNHQKGVPQNAKISKLERISSKAPSQLGFAGEHLFCGTAREVFFKRGPDRVVSEILGPETAGPELVEPEMEGPKRGALNGMY